MYERVTRIFGLAVALTAGCDDRHPSDGDLGAPLRTQGSALDVSAVTGCQVVADATGVRDATGAFEAALECAAKNALAPVVVPKGTFAIAKKLVVPVGVAVVGEPAGAIGSLPTLLFPERFEDDGLVLSERASISGVHVRFAGVQAPAKAAIRVGGVGSSVQHVRVTNAGIGIFSPPDLNSGRLYVNDVVAVDNRIGVWVDLGYDVSRFENIVVERGVAAPQTYGVVFGQNDYMLASKISVVRVATGVEFRANGGGTGATLGSFTSFTAKECDVGLSVTSSSRISATGMTIDAREAALRVRDNAFVSMSSSRLTTSSGSTIQLSQAASLTLSGSVIDRTAGASGNHGVYVDGGRFLNLTGNAIASQGHGVFFAASPQRAVIAGNTMTLTNPSGRGTFGAIDANVTIGANGANR